MALEIIKTKVDIVFYPFRHIYLRLNVHFIILCESFRVSASIVLPTA